MRNVLSFSSTIQVDRGLAIETSQRVKVNQAAKDFARDSFVINSKPHLGAELGVGLVEHLVATMEAVLDDVGLRLDLPEAVPTAPQTGLVSLAEALMVKASRSNSGAQSLFFLHEQFCSQGSARLRPVAASDLAKPLLLRVRASGLGGGAASLECSCVCTSYYRMRAQPGPDDDDDDEGEGEGEIPFGQGASVSEQELRQSVLEVSYQDAVSLSLALRPGASSGSAIAKPGTLLWPATATVTVSLHKNEQEG